MPIYRSFTGNEKYANGRQVFRKGGKFARPTLQADACPNCRRLYMLETNPVRINGFIDPLTMRPKPPSRCRNCGHPLTADGWWQAFNEMIMEG